LDFFHVANKKIDVTFLQDQSKLLNSLVEDLTTIDKQLIELKHLKFDGKDPYGEEEDRVESAIQGI